ncbi:MAG: CPBP family intramembrane metalloprotease [Saprospiraceae bacterium]|nr:CPBP family intramembrane metalloprotease [Saprospiraceae bacterium]
MKHTNLIILIAMIVITFFAFRRDKKKYEEFTSLEETEKRQKFFKLWTVEPFFLYGLLSLVILFWIEEINALMVMPEFLVEFVNSIKSKSGIRDSKIISGMLKGIKISIIPSLILGSIIGTYFREYQANKSKKIDKKLESGDNDFRNLESLIPRNYKERIWGAILSVNAGFSEELFFRLLAPILIYSVTGSASISIIASTIWFGLGHYYQGVSGILVTFLLGLLLFSVFLITKNIWITMIVHATLDINGLVLSPWLKERYEIQNKQ